MNKIVKQSIVRFVNAYYLREWIMLLRYNKFSLSSDKMPMLISAIDGRRNTQGLTDRFKGIISVYALSKALNVSFRCVYTSPFNLTDFLIPNKYNWLPRENELSDSVKDVRFKILRKQLSMKRLLKLLPLKKQIRVYANIDYLNEINRIYKQNYRWGELFKELFKTTAELEKQLRYHLDKIGHNEFTACVFRFQSLLGDFKEYNYSSVPQAKQQELIEKNRNALKKIIEEVKTPVLVTSDSSSFITAVSNIKHVYTLLGRVVHLDCTLDAEKDVYMKSFIDFFLISNARKVYSIGTKEMYPTQFPLYAAKINNVPFERILID